MNFRSCRFVREIRHADEQEEEEEESAWIKAGALQDRKEKNNETIDSENCMMLSWDSIQCLFDLKTSELRAKRRTTEFEMTTKKKAEKKKENGESLKGASQANINKQVKSD